jgi:putative transposase
VAKTSEALARLVWEMASANPQWGRRRIALTLGSLEIFLAASTVRNLLLRRRPRPTGSEVAALDAEAEQQAPRQIVARYPNHVWSLDRTRVMRWGIFPTWVLAAIDHYSRKVMVLCALEGPNAGWVVGTLEATFARHGSPRHLISDQEGVFISDAFRDLLRRWDVRQRFGAVGQHGSIAVTERLIWSLKHEWLKRVPIIRGLGHLEAVLDEFACYHNDWRAHSALDGALPALVHAGQQWQPPERTARRAPTHIERHFFATAKVTAFRLPEAV